MKYLLILGMLFTGWPALGQTSLSGQWYTSFYYPETDALAYLKCKYDLLTDTYYEFFKSDLLNRINSLPDLNVEDRNIEDVRADVASLKPRPSFTKPHRYLLTRKLAPYSGSKNTITMCGQHDHPYCLLNDPFSDLGDLDPLKVSLIKEYIKRSEEHFNIDFSNYYHVIDLDLTGASNWNKGNKEIRCGKDSTKSPWEEGLVSRLHLRDLLTRNWTNPTDRWWWNENIKPLLEELLMLYNLEHGEYEPY